jgi:hypothetical protein
MEKYTYKKATIPQKIKTFFNNLVFKYITNPRLKKENKIKVEKFKKDFEEKQRAAVKRVKEIMFHDKVRSDNNNKLEYLNKKLVEGRNNVIKESKYVSHIPAFYEPEICEIHNESLHLKRKNFNELILEEDEVARLTLKKQTDKIGQWDVAKPSTFWARNSNLKKIVNDSGGKLTDGRNDDSTLSYQDLVDIDKVNSKNDLTKLKNIIDESRGKLTND